LRLSWARRLAVDGDQIMPAGPEFLDPALKTAPEQHRIETIDQRPQPAGTRNPKMKWREPSQKIQVMLAPCNDFIKIVAICDSLHCMTTPPGTASQVAGISQDHVAR